MEFRQKLKDLGIVALLGLSCAGVSSCITRWGNMSGGGPSDLVYKKCSYKDKVRFVMGPTNNGFIIKMKYKDALIGYRHAEVGKRIKSCAYVQDDKKKEIICSENPQGNINSYLRDSKNNEKDMNCKFTDDGRAFGLNRKKCQTEFKAKQKDFDRLRCLTRFYLVHKKFYKSAEENNADNEE
ncbi:MAG: hypothetical protein U9Q69_01000 [Nanoarchaeota archaeon]|nr:hypothetical protein [Nanoarchaeota archaeon]